MLYAQSTFMVISGRRLKRKQVQTQKTEMKMEIIPLCTPHSPSPPLLKTHLTKNQLSSQPTYLSQFQFSHLFSVGIQLVFSPHILLYATGFHCAGTGQNNRSCQCELIEHLVMPSLNWQGQNTWSCLAWTDKGRTPGHALPELTRAEHLVMPSLNWQRAEHLVMPSLNWQRAEHLVMLNISKCTSVFHVQIWHFSIMVWSLTHFSIIIMAWSLKLPFQ